VVSLFWKFWIYLEYLYICFLFYSKPIFCLGAWDENMHQSRPKPMTLRMPFSCLLAVGSLLWHVMLIKNTSKSWMVLVDYSGHDDDNPCTTLNLHGWYLTHRIILSECLIIQEHIMLNFNTWRFGCEYLYECFNVLLHSNDENITQLSESLHGGHEGVLYLRSDFNVMTSQDLFFWIFTTYVKSVWSLESFRCILQWKKCFQGVILLKVIIVIQRGSFFDFEDTLLNWKRVKICNFESHTSLMSLHNDDNPCTTLNLHGWYLTHRIILSECFIQ
jgi:hypothetical protein